MSISSPLPPAAPDPTVVRHAMRLHGLVQGVGMRPFVHRLATGLGLAGHVGNDADGVFIEVEGPGEAVAAFEARLITEAPPLAYCTATEPEPLAAVGEERFRIVPSRPDGAVQTFVAPDTALCADCRRELLDPDDRRFRYPFITCTNCGPRFTITERLPYDRPNTTMRGFSLCAACAAQYDDPADRRFHAQPLACGDCGPAVRFERDGVTVDGIDAVVAAAQEALAEGAVVAVKGLGGYHLACRATDDAVLQRLRERKGRADKPFAVMARDLAVARRLVVTDAAEEGLLCSPAHPIVLCRGRSGSGLSPLVAPGNPLVGVMLPYSPLHHLLFEPVPHAVATPPDALVMTSGNLTDEPICFQDADARRRLGPIADAWLVHDRPIHVPCDDSVVRVVDGEELPIRRSRGYAPLPIPLPVSVEPVLAVGGELKTTFCLAAGRTAWMSQHLGDMGSVETLAAFERSTEQFRSVYQLDPGHLAADAHPGYHTRHWAEARDPARLSLVQHHHAHIAAAMAEHGIPPGQPVVGFAFDGTGYGTDGAIWGGEVLVADYERFERLAHLRYIPLPGGDAAIRHPYRVALAHLWAAGIEWEPDLAPVQAARPGELAVLERQLDRDVHCVPTSSMGRLFDAVSSLAGLRHDVSYEAQAAIELEAAATRYLDGTTPYRFDLDGPDIDPRPVVRAVVEDRRAGRPSGIIAAAFHQAVAEVVVRLARRARQATKLDRVVLSGGVFQNALLVSLTRRQLRAEGFDVLTHRLVPPNDGGLALGQVLVAASQPAPNGSEAAP